MIEIPTLRANPPEWSGAKGSDPLQAVVLEPIDGRFNGWVRLPGGGEVRGRLPFALVGGGTSLPKWYGRQRHQLASR